MQRSSAIAGDLLLFQRTSSSLAHERPASASEPSGSKGGTSAADADAAALRWCGRGRLSQVKLSPLGQSQAVAGHTFTAWAVAGCSRSHFHRLGGRLSHFHQRACTLHPGHAS